MNPNLRLVEDFFTSVPSFPEAACMDVSDPDMFFPDPKDVPAIQEAKDVCMGCVHRNACAQYAIEAELSHGIFGGLTPEERHRIKPRTSRNRHTVVLDWRRDQRHQLLKRYTS